MTLVSIYGHGSLQVEQEGKNGSILPSDDEKHGKEQIVDEER